MFGYLRHWRTDSTHFPRLEHLRLQYLEELEEIPLSIGDLPMLKSILLVGCSESAAYSAKIIEQEQVDNLNEDLKVLIGKILNSHIILVSVSAFYLFSDPSSFCLSSHHMLPL
ncbi:hypothetical protein ACS0TY_004755 [Phlomoides rotata]